MKFSDKIMADGSYPKKSVFPSELGFQHRSLYKSKCKSARRNSTSRARNGKEKHHGGL